MSRDRPLLLGALVAIGAAAAFAFVGGAGGEGTVIAKGDAAYDYACQAGGTMTGPVAVPVWGATCSVPRCWRLVVQDSDGTTSEPCVSREEYDQVPVGSFRHRPTDR